MTSRPVPRLNLAESLGLVTDRENKSHKVREVEEGEVISWGTPPPTQRNPTPKKTPVPSLSLQQIDVIPEPTQVQETIRTPQAPKPKYAYLDSAQRPPLGEMTGRIPADPLQQRVNEAQEMGVFFDQFKKTVMTSKSASFECNCSDLLRSYLFKGLDSEATLFIKILKL